MLHIDDGLADESFADDAWTDAIPGDLGLWSDALNDDHELELSWHRLPTEQELRDMEANSATGKLEELRFRDRRTALRH